MDDKYECCVEVMDVKLPLSDFPVNTMCNAMRYKTDETTNEKIYTWAKDENLGFLYELIDGEFVLTQDTTVDLTKTYYIDALEHDDFSEDFTYGWRYLYEGDDDEENAEVFDYCKQKWIELYRFITTSTDEAFKANFGNYFVLDTALYYYLFTTRYCMVDNRSKNLFFHYGKTGEVDSDGNPVRKWDLTWGYDMDTALGLNNYGKQVYRYGLEDIDIDEKGEEIFRESDSTFFCRIRDLFKAELKTLYQTLESKNAWHAESFLNKCDAWQSEFPEELWRLDIERKYIRTYSGSFINGKADSQFLVNMANGKMKYHRREWERNQEKYMASKYQSTAVSHDDNSVTMRCAAPSGNLVVQPKYSLKLTPYAYMYLNVEYATGVVQVRANPGVEYEIPFDGEQTDIIKVYGASCIQSLGDLSPCYLATIGTGPAVKLKELKIGNATAGYDNPYFTTFTPGANPLLEKLDFTNVSGLTQTLELGALNNLRELYAHGSNTTGVRFADGGRIEIAELPAINVLTMKNLLYLTTLDIADFSRLTTITVENCNTVDLLQILNSAPNINRARIIGVDWSLDDSSLLERIYAMRGLDQSNHNTDRAVLTGKVHVNIIREQLLYDYQEAWPDLEITYNTRVDQFVVTFKNDDGTILETQYVDIGKYATDPVASGKIPTPTKESSVSTDFTYAGWDINLNATQITRDITVTATYTETTRTYTIKYMSMGQPIQTSSGLYGDYIPYTGATPTYTLEESSGLKYYLFTGWDKSGFVDGNKTVNAVFDSVQYFDGYFDGKDIENMRPVEIYALLKLDAAKTISISDYVVSRDAINIQLGNDFTYSDVEQQVLIAEPMTFDGSNKYDTNLKLLDEDRDFVLAIDYLMESSNTVNAVLAQCFAGMDMSGFRLLYNNGVKFAWGDNSVNPNSAVNKREMMVIKHIKGENGLHVYTSNVTGNSMYYVELDGIHSMIHDVSLVFGCSKLEDGSYEKYAKGTVYWSKVWFANFGDDICEQLACWPHEDMSFEACFEQDGDRQIPKRYYLSDGSRQRSSLTFMAKHALSSARAMHNSSSSNSGGWASYSLNTYLNSRIYQAFPNVWKLLVKQVIVKSTAGAMSTTLVDSNCHIFIPSYSEIANITTDPYIGEGAPIVHCALVNDRVVCTPDGVAVQYWTRSPDVSYSSYIKVIGKDGYEASLTRPNNSSTYVRIMFSI